MVTMPRAEFFFEWASLPTCRKLPMSNDPAIRLTALLTETADPVPMLLVSAGG